MKLSVFIHKYRHTDRYTFVHIYTFIHYAYTDIFRMCTITAVQWNTRRKKENHLFQWGNNNKRTNCNEKAIYLIILNVVDQKEQRNLSR